MLGVSVREWLSVCVYELHYTNIIICNAHLNLIWLHLLRCLVRARGWRRLYRCLANLMRHGRRLSRYFLQLMLCSEAPAVCQYFIFHWAPGAPAWFPACSVAPITWPIPLSVPLAGGIGTVGSDCASYRQALPLLVVCW